VLFGGPLPDAFSYFGIFDQRGVSLGDAQIALRQGHLHEVYERLEERPLAVHLPQEGEAPVRIFDLPVERGAGAVPGREQETILGPGKDPGDRTQALYIGGLHPAGRAAADVEEGELPYRGGFGEKGDEIFDFVNQLPVSFAGNRGEPFQRLGPLFSWLV